MPSQLTPPYPPQSIPARHLKPTTTAHCAAAAPALTLVTCVVSANPPVVPAKAGTSHPSPASTAGMEGNGREWKRIKSLPLLCTPEDRSTPGMAPPSACRTGSFRRSRERGGTSHPRPPVRSPRPLGEGQGEGSGGRQCNQMQLNATELKVSPLLATPDEATAIGSRATPAHRVRVNGVPNEATVVSFSASQLGVNEANQGQMGPRFRPPVVPAKAA